MDIDLLKQNLKRYRKAHKLTQDELAAFLKKERSLIAKYETGKAIPPLPILEILAKLYNISVDTLCIRRFDENDLVFHSAKSEGEDNIEYSQLTKQEQLLILKLRLLDETALENLYEKIDEVLHDE